MGRPDKQRGVEQSAQSGDLGFGELPWVSGAIVGASYFIASFFVTVLLFILDLAMSASGSTGGYNSSGEQIFYALGWLFYNAHNVSIVGPGGGSVDLLAQITTLSTIPRIVYLAVPPVFLFLAGRSVARGHVQLAADQTDLAKLGATVTAGYLPLALLGKFVFTQNGVGPEMATTVALPGVAYPVVFGAVGGYFATR